MNYAINKTGDEGEVGSLFKHLCTWWEMPVLCPRRETTASLHTPLLVLFQRSLPEGITHPLLRMLPFLSSYRVVLCSWTHFPVVQSLANSCETLNSWTNHLTKAKRIPASSRSPRHILERFISKFIWILFMFASYIWGLSYLVHIHAYNCHIFLKNRLLKATIDCRHPFVNWLFQTIFAKYVFLVIWDH